jgi:hypothetical protein
MQQTLILRRSAVSGNKPTVSKLALGEIAINTYDGKLFIHRSGSNGASIEEILVGNTQNTGSLTISGSSHTLIGDTSVTGSLSAKSTNGSLTIGDYSEITQEVTGSVPYYMSLKNGITDIFKINSEGVMQIAAFDP